MESLRTQMPADIEREDQLLGPLSPRQVLLCVVCACAAYGVMQLVARFSNVTVGLIATLPIAIACAAVIFSSRDGLTGDRYVRAAAQYAMRPKRYVYAPEGLPSSPDFADCGVDAAPYVGQGVGFDEALLLLGNQGLSLVVEIRAVPFSLRSNDEQLALLSSYSRFLNSATSHLQILIRTERAATQSVVAQLQSDAKSLPHPALERTAIAHAEFLESLSSSTKLFRRRVFMVIHSRRVDAFARGEINRELSELERFVRGVGGTLDVLPREEVISLLDVTP